MFLVEVAAVALMAQAPIVVTGEPGVGYEPLMQDRPAAAIAEIESNTRLDADDPALLINLGVAYARQGHTAMARAKFEEAMKSADRMTLETSEGEWKDSRHHARLALKMLDAGELVTQRMAVR